MCIGLGRSISNARVIIILTREESVYVETV